MKDIRSFKRSRVQGHSNSGSSISSAVSQRISFCAYNQTRERFVSNKVEVGDSSLELLEARLASLEQTAGVALWISPFRELPITIVRFPVDLVFLDQDCVVLHTAESFPISASPLPEGLVPSSTLVFPSRVLSSATIQIGDGLILCDPEDMERRLNQKRRETFPPGVVPDVNESSNLPTVGGTPAMEDLMREAKPHVPDTQAQRNGDLVALEASLEPASPRVDPATMGSAAEASPAEPSVRFSRKSWWRRFLAGEPPDPRRGDREAIPGLIAYFFTGGAPIRHSVRDISSNGLYVITEERWYPGTVIRVTLSDQTEPSGETSLTLHAKVARSGPDGVGLQFLLFDQKDVERGNVPPDLDMIVSPARFEDFVRKFKKSRA